jgi:hypothetical protein
MAIAAVTAALQQVLDRVRQPLFPGEVELGDVEISSGPPDTSKQQGDRLFLNLFLYQVSPNAAWRNLPVSTQGAPSDTSRAPLALNLHYLLTVFGKADDDLRPHLLLGRALAVLNDRSTLPNDILAGLGRSRPQLAGSNLHRQSDRVRLTPTSLSLEDMTRLWGVLQTKYRLSVAFQLSVVLIDSADSSPPALPVLNRGSIETGQAVQASMIPVGPQLDSLELSVGQPAAELGVPARLLPSGRPAIPGDVVTVMGRALSGRDLSVQLQGLPGTFVLPAAQLISTSASTIAIRLPDEQVALPAGFYSLSLRLRRVRGPGIPDALLTSNGLPFAVAPRLLQVGFAPATTATSGPARGRTTPPTISVRVSPQVWPEQRVSLLIGDEELPLPAVTDKTNDLSLPLTNVALARGTYLVRVRVDGVDSVPTRTATNGTLEFDPQQQVSIP